MELKSARVLFRFYLRFSRGGVTSYRIIRQAAVACVVCIYIVAETNGWGNEVHISMGDCWMLLKLLFIAMFNRS